MALPAGRYGVTKNQLLKIKKLPMNTIKLIEELTEKFDLLGSAAFKNSTSVVTQSTDLVESGAVYDTIKDTNGWIGGNILPFPYKESSHTHNGIAYTVNSNGTVRAVGTATGNSDFYLFGDEIPSWMKSGVDYILSGCPEQPEVESYSIQYNNWTEGASYVRTDTGNGVTIKKIEDSNTQKLRIRVYDGKTVDITFNPMISKVKMPYIPYHPTVDEQKADNSVIGTVEDGATVQKSDGYAVGSHAIRNGAFITWKNAKAQGETINDASDYTSGDVAEMLDRITGVATDPLTGVTIDSNRNLFVKRNNNVDFTVRITVSNNLDNSFHSLLKLPFICEDDKFVLVINDSSLNVVTSAILLKNTHTIFVKELNAGTYNISGSYYTN